MVDFGSAGSIGNLLPHGRALRIALTLPRTAPPAPPPARTRHPRPVPDAPNNFTGHLQGRLTIVQKGQDSATTSQHAPGRARTATRGAVPSLAIPARPPDPSTNKPSIPSHAPFSPPPPTRSRRPSTSSSPTKNLNTLQPRSPSARWGRAGANGLGLISLQRTQMIQLPSSNARAMNKMHRAMTTANAM